MTDQIHPEATIRAVRDLLENIYRSLRAEGVELIGTRFVSNIVLYVLVRDVESNSLNSTLHDILRIEVEMPSTSVQDTAGETMFRSIHYMDADYQGRDASGIHMWGTP
jgi:hypothetical protein